MSETDESKPLRDRQETFCQIYADGKLSASEAFRQAGYAHKHAEANSARMTAKDSIKDRIAHIQADRAQEEGITRQGQSRKLALVASKCYSNGEHGTYVRAIEAQNRLYGLDKQVIEQVDAHRELTGDQAQKAKDYAQFELWRANRPGGGHGVGKGEIVPLQDTG